MLIYRCDRCKKLMNKPTFTIKRLKAELDFYEEIDLCEKCNKELEQFIQGVATKGITNE